MTSEETIERGRQLKTLRDDTEAFKPFLAELDDRISQYRADILDHECGARIPAYRALRLLREWLDDEIERGWSEHLRQQKISGQSDKDPKEVKSSAHEGNGE